MYSLHIYLLLHVFILFVVHQTFVKRFLCFVKKWHLVIFLLVINFFHASMPLSLSRPPSFNTPGKLYYFLWFTLSLVFQSVIFFSVPVCPVIAASTKTSLTNFCTKEMQHIDLPTSSIVVILSYASCILLYLFMTHHVPSNSPITRHTQCCNLLHSSFY